MKRQLSILACLSFVLSVSGCCFAAEPTAEQLQEQIAKRFPGSLWHKASGKLPKALEGKRLPLSKKNGFGVFPVMNVDARSPLAGFNDQTIFVVYKSNLEGGDRTILKIGDPDREDHALAIKENAFDYQNKTDCDSTPYRYKYHKYPCDEALKDPVLDTQTFFINPPTADVKVSCPLPQEDIDGSVLRRLGVGEVLNLLRTCLHHGSTM